MTRTGPDGRRDGRYTQQVVDQLRSRGAASAQELFSRMRTDGSPVGLSTVYRELRGLAVRGDVLAIPLGAETVYELRAGAVLLDAALCVACGRRERVPRADGESGAAGLAGSFLTPAEPVVVHGVCHSCATRR